MKMFTKIVSILSVIALFAVAQANASGPTKKPTAPKAMMNKNTQTGAASTGGDDVSASSTPTGAGIAIGVATTAIIASEVNE